MRLNSADSPNCAKLQMALAELSLDYERKFLVLAKGEHQIDECKHIKPVLDRVLPLRHAAEAHRLMASNQVAGNIVLRP